MKTLSTKNLVLTALLTALVVILQLLSLAARAVGIPFAISLALIPIVVGAAVSGPRAGAWLGFVCSVVVLFTDSAAFMTVNALGTILTVIVKGVASGYLAGLTYLLLRRYNKVLAATAAAIVCPVVNTGIFLIGCKIFFMDTIAGWANAAGMGTDVAGYMIFGLVGINFVIELAANIILSPVLVHLLKIKENSTY